jgi:RES domain-containing protein
MKVYRITLEKWSRNLTASGFPARWNSHGRFVIYTANSRALACLENVVHRSGEGLNQLFKVMIIDIPEDLLIKILPVETLPDNWASLEMYQNCQQIGDNWLNSVESAVLQVPSAIIPNECNFLLNPAHPDFSKIKLIATEDFIFDSRVKSAPEP